MSPDDATDDSDGTTRTTTDGSDERTTSDTDAQPTSHSDGQPTDGATGTNDATETDDATDATDATETDDATDATDAADTTDATELTHTDESGEAGMVNVGNKPDSQRRAVARGEITLQPSTIEAVRADETAKGDVLSVARVGAIRAVKHTWEAIPLCHQIPITGTDVTFDLRADRVVCTVAVETTGKTGCEMEALQGVTGGLATVWDMVKAAEKTSDGEYPHTRIGDVRVIEKTKRQP